MAFRRWITLLALLLVPSAAIGQQRVVYVLTGQSNTDLLGTTILAGNPCAWSGPSPANVTYHLTFASAPTAQWPKGQQQLSGDYSWAVAAFQPPLQVLGSRLALQQPSAQIQIVHAAWSGSALLWRNRQPNGEAWVDPVTPGNTSTLGRRLETVMQQLALGAQDELHFVWGQGESDCFLGATTQEGEYSDWVRLLFGWLAQAAGKTKYSVHLVTLGGMYDASLPPTTTNALRDAFFRLPDNPLTLPGQAASYAPVAHHYDMAHPVGDAYHLTPCGYRALADRIADGILQPGLVPRVLDAGMSVAPNGFDIVVQTSTPLAAVGAGPGPTTFFSLAVNGVPVAPAGFQVSTSGADLIVRYLAGGLTSSTPIELRHVPGTGWGTTWQTTVPIQGAALALPLEPFVLRQ